MKELTFVQGIWLGLLLFIASFLGILLATPVTAATLTQSSLPGAALGNVPSGASSDESSDALSDVTNDNDFVRSGRWIEIILEDQRLAAWEDGRMMMSTPVSTGTRKTPTPKGTFRIYRKYERTRMRGPDYDLPDVPYAMYFREGGYAMHGTYWHSNFGQPMSHGCVNLPTGKAAWLFQWAPPGTAVVVH